MHCLVPAHNAGIRYKLLMYFCFVNAQKIQQKCLCCCGCTKGI